MPAEAPEDRDSPGLCLELISPDGEVLSEVEVQSSPLTIGRDEVCDLRLDDRKCSREHARIELQEDGWTVVDLGSVNRTLLDGVPVTSARLENGHVLQLGNSQLRVRRPAAGAHVSNATVPAPPVAPTRRREANRALLLLCLAAALAAGFEAGQRFDWPWVPRPEQQNEGLGLQPRTGASAPRRAEVEVLAESLLASARQLSDAGHLGGAYAALAALDASLGHGAVTPASETIEKVEALRATLDVLATEAWTKATRTIDDAQKAQDWDSARAALQRARAELAGTPHADRVDEAVVALETLIELVRAPEPPATEVADSGSHEVDGTAPAEIEQVEPEAASGKSADESTAQPAHDRTLRGGDLDLVAAHLTELLAQMHIDQAVRTATALAPRLPARDPPTGDSWQNDPSWMISTMPQEARLRQELLDAIPVRAAAGDPIELEVPGATARIVAADDRGLVLAVGETGEGRKDWVRMDASTYVGLLEQLREELGNDYVLLAGAWARRGMSGRGLELLARLHDQGVRWGQLVAQILSLWQGLPAVPEGGYVILRGDLMSIEERDGILATERAAKEAHEAELRRLSATSPENLPRTLVDYAERLFVRGQFERGHALLVQLVLEFPDHPAVRAVAGKAAPNAILASEFAHSVPAVAPGGPPPANRLVVLIAGDGYVLSDRRQVSFSKAADRVIEGFLDHEPFAEYAPYVVFQKAYCISKDKTISDEYTQRESLFGGFRPRLGGQVEIDWGRSRRILDESFGDQWDTALVMVRQGSLGKGLLRADLCAFQEGAVSIAFHEFGHSFVGVLDEYSTDPYGGRPLSGPIPTGPNLVTSTELETCPWKHWIEAKEPGIGFHLGGAGRPKGVWHPSSHGCVMDAGTDFCVVCREQAVLSIYDHVRPVERAEPDADTPLILLRPLGDPEKESTGVVLRIALMKPATHELEVEWQVNGQPPRLGRAYSYRSPATGEWLAEARLPYACFDESDHRSGQAANLVTARVHDPTPWVLSDPGGLLTETVTWQVHARPPAAVVTPAEEEER